ncbi:hypothetical protein B4U79_17966 [Dinothrombium tinctorium]|uniref:F-box domain-containing protein n=1 Tax=Dinothrombium tinctorium TaxID=1965070 RepID=A0A443RDT6_9ACAR|nr:hypothetical protein B4U79_17966 [Dinothrombium tinctorium]
MSISESGEQTDESHQLSHLNADILFGIFKYLQRRDLLAMRLVSRSAKEIITSIRCRVNVADTELKEFSLMIHKLLPGIDKLTYGGSSLLRFSIASEPFQNLRKLFLYTCEDISTAKSNVTQVFRNFTNLQDYTWIISGEFYPIKTINSFPPNVKSFTLRHVSIEREEFASFLNSNQYLEHLELSDVAIEPTGEWVGLKLFFEEFIRNSASIKYLSIQTLKSKFKIERLNIIGGKTLEQIRIQIFDLPTFDRSFPFLTNVKTLFLQVDTIQDSELDFFLSRLPNLEILFIRTWSESLSEKTFEAIARLSKLKTFGLDMCDISDNQKCFDIFKSANACKYLFVCKLISQEWANALIDVFEAIASKRKNDLIKVKMDCGNFKLNRCYRNPLVL